MRFDVQRRHALLQESRRDLRLYALVDGVQYTQQVGANLTPLGGQRRALFDGTPDAPLAHAGPWLIDVQQAAAESVDELVALEQTAPAVTWLIAPLALERLAQLLTARLETRLPDGRTALIRFWDARVLANLAQVLDEPQREAFFADIHEWHLMHRGQRTWIGRHHANAQ
ncbi:MAG: DUF4123 domain-containing protein [Pseudomonadota bacterium]